MRVLFDTNVVLDVLLDRKPFAGPAAELFSRVESGEMKGFLCATTITTIHYLATSVVGKSQARKEIRKLLRLFEVAPVNRIVLESALERRMNDFEDAVIYEAARQIDTQAVVTRDARGFKKSQIPVYTPIELVKMLKGREEE
jgi:predicted nucleic acid-binding protein